MGTSHSPASPHHSLPAVDDYIAMAQPFAQPLLRHLRETVHEAVPEAEEAIKWGMPFFLVRGVILGNMAGHKRHVSFGLWGQEAAQDLQGAGVAAMEGMGSFGRITCMEDLPPAAELHRVLQRAAGLITTGQRTRSVQRVAKPARAAAEVPAALTAALREHPEAARRFDEMSPSGRREYAQWIGEAKQEATRARRVASAVSWIAEGKSRNWKYETERA